MEKAGFDTTVSLLCMEQKTIKLSVMNAVVTSYALWGTATYHALNVEEKVIGLLNSLMRLLNAFTY